MTLLNVSFGIFAFLPQGWLFMLIVMLVESLIMSKYLSGKFLKGSIYLATFLSNIVSGIVGIIASLMITGGWWLVVWFPWVSSHEVNVHNTMALIGFIAYYLVAMLLSVLIEGALNYGLLQKKFGKKKTIKATLWANAVTYLIGAIILCALIFGTSWGW